MYVVDDIQMSVLCSVLVCDYNVKSVTVVLFFFFFNDTATTEIYTLSLHDALPIFEDRHPVDGAALRAARGWVGHVVRSEEHTSELQSQSNLVCRLLLEKKKKTADTCC